MGLLPKTKALGFTGVIVLGAGAVGSYISSQLYHHIDVLLVGRRSHVDAVNAHGLKVEGAAEGLYHLKASTNVDNNLEGSLVILTTKAYDSMGAIAGIGKLLKPSSTILILQNGLGNKEIIKRAVDPEVEVVRGVITMGVEFLEPGRIEVKLAGETILPDTEVGRRVKRLFDDCGLPSRLSENMRLEIWRKAALNCVLNPLTAIFRIPNNAVASPSLAGVRSNIVDEITIVAEMEGVTLPLGLADEITAAASAYSNYSSMFQDIIKGRRTEIDFLNGQISELGRAYGVPTPVNDTLTALIKFLEEKR